MIKLKAKESFTLGRFAEIRMIERVNAQDKDGHIGKGDLFECEKDLAKYLLNETPNPANRAVVEKVETIPEEKKIVKEKVEKVEVKRKNNTKTKKIVKK